MTLLLLLGAALAQDCDLLAAELPDPGAAATLAATIGMGAGHVYAHKPAGLLFGLAESVGFGMLLGGLSMKTSDDSERVENGGKVLSAGIITVATARVVQIPSAVAAAHSTRREMVTACKTTPLLPAGYGLLGAMPSTRPVPEVPAEVRKDVVLLTATQVMQVAGLSTLDPEMEGVRAWVAEQLRQGLSPSEIINKVKAGEGPVQPKVPPAPKP